MHLLVYELYHYTSFVFFISEISLEFHVAYL